MAKKIKNDYDDDYEENINDNHFIDDNYNDDLLENFDNEDEPVFIHIDEDIDSSIEETDSNDNVDIEEDNDQPKNKKRIVKQKPKLIGKHSLTYDTIFKGKKNDTTEESVADSEYIIKNAGGSLDILDDGIEMEESHNSTEYYRTVRLKQEIYKALSCFTDINFEMNRRKPAKTDFNSYYALLIKELYSFGYTKTEIFIELSGYFSDNVYNMFQLLDKQYSNIIILELKENKKLK